MANYRSVAAHFPPVRDYLKNRQWVRRGEVRAYAPNMRTPCFSTDRFGFRHTVFNGREYGIDACETGEPYGLVLGSSHIFGFGLPGDRDTLPSQLSGQLGFPCLNISYPEADSRTLFTTLLRVATRSATKPSLIVFFNGGDLTRYCYSGMADPLFGPPDFGAFKAPQADRDAEALAFRSLAFFVRFWGQQCIELAQRLDIPFCFGFDLTFFEKPDPDPVELACELGTARDPAMAERFAIHKRHVYEYGDIRVALCRDFGVQPPPSVPSGHEAYIDEFHFRVESLGFMAAAIAERARTQL